LTENSLQDLLRSVLKNSVTAEVQLFLPVFFFSSLRVPHRFQLSALPNNVNVTSMVTV
jgi:hypothetical protein